MKLKLIPQLFILILFATLQLNTINAQEMKIQEKKLTEKDLLGEWKVKDIIFENDEISSTDKVNPFSDMNMHSGIERYEFKENGDFSYVVPKKKKNNPQAKKYWTWKFNEDNQSFLINQIKKDVPPYNFGLEAKITEVNKKEGNTFITLQVTFFSSKQATIILTNDRTNWETEKPNIVVK